MFSRILFLAISLLVLSPNLAVSANPSGRIVPDNYIDVDFENVALSELVFLVARTTGLGFVYTDPDNTLITWSQQRIYKDDLLSAFIRAVSVYGFTVQPLDKKLRLFSVKPESSLSSGSYGVSAVYQLRYATAESVKDSVDSLFGTRLTLTFFENNNCVAFSGGPEVVKEFLSLLPRIDQPPTDNILSIRLQHISVRSALKALTDLAIFADKSVFPDYWNRSILVHGNDHQQFLARAVLAAMDKPQEDWVDQVAWIHSMNVDQAVNVLSGLYPDLEIRKVAADRLLLSGAPGHVDKASVTLSHIDGTGLQVKVEAVIAYLTDREFRELGLRLAYDSSSMRAVVNDNIAQSLITRNTGLLLDYFNQTLGLDVAAKEGQAHGEILSSPVLTVLNGQTASIHVGQNVPFLERANFDKNDGTETGTSIKRQDIGLSFRITPSIEPGGDFIHLQVYQELSHVTDDSELSQDAVDIVFDKKEISSTVLVGNGDTIFLGGLRTEEQGHATDYIPFLGELPLIGRLFSYDVDQVETRHLVVSLRVNVVGKTI